MKSSIAIAIAAVVCISLGIFAAVCSAQDRNARVAAIQQKAHAVEETIKQWAADGKNPMPALVLMKQAGQAFDKGDANRGEALVDQAMHFLQSAPPSKLTAAATGIKLYVNPQVVEIEGYEQDAMEPCISLDGNYLFFNNSNELPDTTIFCAKRVAPLKFVLLGKVAGIHLKNETGIGDAREACPTVDTANRLYYTCTATYAKDRHTLYAGTWAPNAVSHVNFLQGDISPKDIPWLNMDSGVSPDGNTLVFARAKVAGKAVPDESYLMIATRARDGNFYIDRKSDNILQKINALNGLKYAPAITADGLELYFTRCQDTKVPMASSADSELMQTMVARRRNTNEPFGAPERLAVIDGFSEAPSLTLDKKELFFHKRIGNRFRINRLQRSTL